MKTPAWADGMVVHWGGQTGKTRGGKKGWKGGKFPGRLPKGVAGRCCLANRGRPKTKRTNGVRGAARTRREPGDLRFGGVFLYGVKTGSKLVGCGGGDGRGWGGAMEMQRPHFRRGKMSFLRGRQGNQHFSLSVLLFFPCRCFVAIPFGGSTKRWATAVGVGGGQKNAGNDRKFGPG